MMNKTEILLTSTSLLILPPAPPFLVEEGGKQDKKMVIAFTAIKGYVHFSCSGLGPDLD